MKEAISTSNFVAGVVAIRTFQANLVWAATDEPAVNAQLAVNHFCWSRALGALPSSAAAIECASGETLMHLVRLVAAAGAVTCVLSGSVEPSTAQTYPNYLYCAYYGGGSGAGGSGAPGVPVCGFNTLEQCRAAVSGSQGYCEPNPWYQGPSVTRRRR